MRHRDSTRRLLESLRARLADAAHDVDAVIAEHAEEMDLCDLACRTLVASRAAAQRGEVPDPEIVQAFWAAVATYADRPERAHFLRRQYERDRARTTTRSPHG